MQFAATGGNYSRGRRARSLESGRLGSGTLYERVAYGRMREEPLRSRIVRLTRAAEQRLARESRRPMLWLLVFAALLATQIDPYWWPRVDGSQYVSIAGSMWSGDGPRAFGSPHLFFAPGYPLLISPAFLVSDKPFLLI